MRGSFSFWSGIRKPLISVVRGPGFRSQPPPRIRGFFSFLYGVMNGMVRNQRSPHPSSSALVNKDNSRSLLSSPGPRSAAFFLDAEAVSSPSKPGPLAWMLGTALSRGPDCPLSSHPPPEKGFLHARSPYRRPLRLFSFFCGSSFMTVSTSFPSSPFRLLLDEGYRVGFVFSWTVRCRRPAPSLPFFFPRTRLGASRLRRGLPFPLGVEGRWV